MSEERKRLAMMRIKGAEFDPMPDLRARNIFLRQVEEIKRQAEEAVRNAEEA